VVLTVILGCGPDRKGPQLFKNVLVDSLEVDVHVLSEEAVDHVMEGVEVRQDDDAGVALRPEQLLIRISLDQFSPALDVYLKIMLTRLISLVAYCDQILKVHHWLCWFNLITSRRKMCHENPPVMSILILIFFYNEFPIIV